MSSRAVASSSMTRTDSAVGERRPSNPVEPLACESALLRRRTVKTEPLPGSLVTVTSPPIIRASLRVMAKPRPVPPYCRAVEESAWVNSSNSLACCSGVIPMPVSATAISIQLPVDHPFDAQLNLPLLGKLAGIAQQIEQDLPQPHGIDYQAAEIVRAFDHEAILILLCQLPRGADDVLKQRRQIHRFRAKLELAGLDLREVEHLVDQAEKMGPRTVNPAQWLPRFFRAEACCIGDHHLSQSDDGIERRAQLMAHAGDELRLVLARHFELTTFFFDLLEQARILDGENRLGGEGLQQIEDGCRKRSGSLAPHHQGAHHLVAAQ